jgi:hypothetical protein
LNEVCQGAKSPVVGVTLRLARGPANKAWWGELYDFLERGYTAAHPMREVGVFVETIRGRELRILERIFAGENDPIN